MADLDVRRASGGFTLVEMLFALGILLFGITALLGTLASSIGQRRTADARLELCALADRIVHRVQHEAIRPGADGGTVDVAFAPLLDQPAEGFPGLTWSANAVADPDRPDLWLVRIDLRWLQAGETVEQSLWRVLPRQLSLPQRVVAFRTGGADSGGADSGGADSGVGGNDTGSKR
jgi:type II secretory pathway pseudopilin PulG